MSDFIVRNAVGDGIMFVVHPDGSVHFTDEATTRDDVARAVTAHLKSSIDQNARMMDAVQKVGTEQNDSRASLISMVIEREMKLRDFRITVVAESIFVFALIGFIVWQRKVSRA